MKSKQKLDEIYHLDKCPFTFQELPETSVPNSMKASLEGKSLDLPGTTSTQQEKRWIGDSEGRHCLCVCFWCLQRRLFFFLFFFSLRCHLHRSEKGPHCLYVQAPREWSLCWGINDNTIWTSHTAFLSRLKVVRQGKQDRNGHSLAPSLCETELLMCLARDGQWQRAGWPEERAGGNKLGRKLKWTLLDWYWWNTQSFKNRHVWQQQQVNSKVKLRALLEHPQITITCNYCTPTQHCQKDAGLIWRYFIHMEPYMWNPHPTICGPN